MAHAGWRISTMIRIIEAKGDYYECGKTFGSLCAENIAYRIAQELPGTTVETYRKELSVVDQTCRILYPDYVRELEGIADGSGVDYWTLLLLNTPELMARHQGCTTIAVSNRKEQYVVHNEDGGATERSEDCVLLHYVLPDRSFYAFSYAGELAGGSYSWNNTGLYLSVNYLKPIHLDFSGRVSRNFVARKIIEAKSIKDAIYILEHGQDVSGYHYYMGQGDKLVSIENFQNDVSVKEVVGVDIHANHYLHDKFIQKASGKPNSLVRQRRAEELVRKGTEPIQVLVDRENLPDAICTEFGEGLHTISTIGFYPQENIVKLYKPETLEIEAEFPLDTISHV
ncbi:C45 family autoproteolytic acyltransferase/hydolase [soil metagenome]